MTQPETRKLRWLDVKRGLRGRCPACGEGRLFASFLTVAHSCAHCGQELFHQRADDLPAYIVVLLTGHIYVPLAVEVELNFAPPVWVHMALWIPLIAATALALLQPVKGAVVALQWRLGMHGFGRGVSP
jgi:uncharacterized protein (DUF983 family)